jgi:hypothetical protein
MENTMKASSKFLLGAIAALAIGAFAYSQLPAGGDSMAGMDHSTMNATADSPSNKAFEAAMGTMMKGMMTPYTGKPTSTLYKA